MARFYYPSPDEVQGDTPLDERIWFEQHQPTLVRLANTMEGRAMLLIDDRHIPIVEVRRNFVRYEIGGGEYLTDFRVGTKWGNVVRSRWQIIKRAIHRMQLEEILAWPRVRYQGKLLLPVGGGLTLTTYPDPHVESTTIDGLAKRGSVNESWSDKLSLAGNGTEDSGGSWNPNLHSGAGSTWRTLKRCIVLFDTSALGATSTIDSGTFEFVVSAKLDQHGSGSSISLVQSSPASNTAIATSDYNVGNWPTATIQAANLTVDGLDDDGSTYNDFVLNAAGLAFVSKTGITKFGVRHWNDVQGSGYEPTWGSDDSTSVTCLSAETTDTSKDPKLVVLYTAGFTPKVIFI